MNVIPAPFKFWQQLAAVWRDLLAAGTAPAQPRQLQMRIRLCNKICLIIGLGLQPFFWLTVLLVSKLIIGTISLTYLCIPFVSRAGYHKLGRFLACNLLLVLLLFMGTMYLEQTMERAQLFKQYIFALVCLPLALFIEEERRWKALGVGLVVFGYFTFDLLDAAFSIVPHPPEGQVVIFFLLRYFVPSILFGLVIFTYVVFQQVDSAVVQEVLATERLKNLELKITEAILRSRETELEQLNGQLEHTIEMRTAELKKSNSILSTALETTSDGILVMTRTGHVQDYNRRFTEIWLVKPHEVPESLLKEVTIRSFQLVKDPEVWLKRVKQIHRQDLTYTEDVLEMKDGKWLLVTSQIPNPPHPEIERVWSYRDITKEVESERVLKEKEARFRTFFELSDEGIVLHNGKGIVKDINPAMARILGYPYEPNLYTGASLLQWVLAEDQPKMVSQLVEGRESTFESRLVSMDGRIVPCEINARTVIVGEKTMRAALVHDLTERKQAEQQLLAIARTIPQPILIIRFHDGQILYVNEPYERLFKYEAEELVGGKSKNLYYYEADKNRLRDALRASNSTLNNFEICARSSTGEPVWVIINTAMIAYKGEDAIIFGFQDISERLKSEKLLRESKDRMAKTLAELKTTRNQLALAEKLATLGQLLAGVAHEINTPIAATRASAQNMQDVLPLALQSLSVIVREADKMQAELLSRFIEITFKRGEQLSTKAERALRQKLQLELTAAGFAEAETTARKLVEIGFSGKITEFLPLLNSPIGPTALDVIHRIGQVMVNMENIKIASSKTGSIVQALRSYTHTSQPDQAERVNLLDNLNTILILYAHQIRQKVKLETDFEATPVVIANADRLGQIWTNLITNALHSSQAGGLLSIELFELGHHAVVRVADQGTGIAPEVLPHIFDPFFTTKAKGEGTGLGLNICKAIIESYGGTISVESRPGHTVFTVQLPLAPALVAED